MAEFVRNVTDCGKPRAAKGGFPYPGHRTLERADYQASGASLRGLTFEHWRQRKAG